MTSTERDLRTRNAERGSCPRRAQALLVLAFALAPGVAEVLAAQETTEAPSPSEKQATQEDSRSNDSPKAILVGRWRDWLDEVAVLITPAERALFARLEKDYQRDAFIRRFWQVRDPYPQTARNELKERWAERVEFVRNNYGNLEDARSQVHLLQGEATRKVEVRCTTTRIPAEIWLYNPTPKRQFRIVLVFFNTSRRGKASLWIPGRNSADAAARAAQSCMNGSLLTEIVEGIRSAGSDYEIRLARLLAKPRPMSTEWTASFAATNTDVPADAETFPVELEVDFLGRHQSRTVVQGTVTVLPRDVEASSFAGYHSYDFLLLGDVVSGGQLLESFRYKFSFPLGEEGATPVRIPMAFQRFLRPGTHRVVLRLEDLNRGSFSRIERTLEVPRLAEELVLPEPGDSETRALFEEATAAVAAGQTTIRLLPPAGDLHTGFVRFDTLATGDDIQRVAFFLDGRHLMTRNSAPWNVEIDLGPFPRLHSVRVEALDSDGERVAEDEMSVNAGGYRFALRLLDPARGRSFERSLRARAEVQVPENGTLDRVEFFLDEQLVATLYQEPFVQPIQLPRPGRAGFVRAVAYLTDGNTTEDLVFINSPDNVVEEVEVQFVELFASVLDGSGRPLDDLTRDDFEVHEDGTQQEITRFERVLDLPIHVGVLIDNSASMRGSLDTTRKAALTFFEQAITPRDRAAVITFNRFPVVAVKLTNDLKELGSGLAGLTAEGQTALYDSVMFTMYYFGGIRGQRAILLLSDGKDEVSRFDFDETIEYARRAGVTIYSIGLGIRESGARRRLERLADETGGKSYFIRNVLELSGIYDRVQRDLRSQYLIAYQSSNTSKSEEFRQVRLEVDRSGATVKTMSGYYP